MPQPYGALTTMQQRPELHKTGTLLFRGETTHRERLSIFWLRPVLITLHLIVQARLLNIPPPCLDQLPAPRTAISAQQCLRVDILATVCKQTATLHKSITLGSDGNVEAQECASAWITCNSSKAAHKNVFLVLELTAHWQRLAPVSAVMCMSK